MTWGELIRRLKAAGFVEQRRGKGSHPRQRAGGIMTQYFPVIVEQESNGTFSAWVAGLQGVYAAADIVTAAKRGIRRALAARPTPSGCRPSRPRQEIDRRARP